MNKKRIAVLGACYTREVFNSDFVPNWRDEFEITLTCFQNSFASITSKPIPYKRKPLKEKNNFWTYLIFEECIKDTLDFLAGNQPDYILFDFFGDSKGINFVNGYSYLNNHNWFWDDFGSSTFDSLCIETITTKNNYDEVLRLTQEGFCKFIDFVNQYLPQTVLIYNSKKPAILIRRSDEIVRFERRADEYERCYKFFEDMQNYIQNNFPQIRIIDMGDDYYLREETIVHFELNYHEDFYNKFLELTGKLGNRNEEHCSNNLIINSDFRNNTLFWRSWNSKFVILNRNLLLFKNLDKESKWNYLQCNDIEVGGLANKISISFECKIFDESLITQKSIFNIKSYNKRYKFEKESCLDNIAIGYDYDSVELEDGFRRYIFSFEPKGNVLTCGPYFRDTGNVLFRNIMVNVGEYRKYDCSFQEKLLLEEEDQLVDVNYKAITNLRYL